MKTVKRWKRAVGTGLLCLMLAGAVPGCGNVSKETGKEQDTVKLEKTTEGTAERTAGKEDAGAVQDSEKNTEETAPDQDTQNQMNQADDGTVWEELTALELTKLMGRLGNAGNRGKSDGNVHRHVEADRGKVPGLLRLSDFCGYDPFPGRE